MTISLTSENYVLNGKVEKTFPMVILLLPYIQTNEIPPTRVSFFTLKCVFHTLIVIK